MLKISNAAALTQAGLSFRTPESCAAFYSSLVDDNEFEILCVIYVTVDLKVLRVDLRSGGREFVENDLRGMVDSAMHLGASGVILLHNHPSGDPLPSRGDKRFTWHIASILDAISVTVLDHIIVTADGGLTSFRRAGLL